MKRILFAALVSGFATSLLLTAIQLRVVTPMILEAETYEIKYAIKLDVGSHAEAEDTWTPSNGIERNLFTALSNAAAGVGFSLLIIIGLTFHPGRTWWHGLAWGAGGVTAFYLVPTLAYAPALPGTLQSEVLIRQLWWLATVEGTIFGIALMTFARNWLGRAVGAVVIAMPHLIGVPPGDAVQFVPEALANSFFTVNIVINIVFWLLLGAMTIGVYRYLETHRLFNTADVATTVQPTTLDTALTQYRAFDLAYRILGSLVLVAFFLSLYMAHSHATLSQRNTEFLGRLNQQITQIDLISERLLTLSHHTHRLDALKEVHALQDALRARKDALPTLNVGTRQAFDESAPFLRFSSLMNGIQNILPRAITVINKSSDQFTESAAWRLLQLEMDEFRIELNKLGSEYLNSTKGYATYTHDKNINLQVIEYSLLMVFPLIAGAFALYGNHVSQRISHGINEQTHSLQIALEEKEFAVRELQEMNRTLEEHVRLRTQTLEEAQHQLVDAAYKSGMAEIATGVLHNISNILNSVMLSGKEVARILISKDIQGLRKANEMLAAHREDAAEFLSRDEKGRLLPQYYLALGEALTQDYEFLTQEITSLNEKTVMMRDVIATQQAYARASQYVEHSDIVRIIEDALQVQEASLIKSNVVVNRRFQNVPLCSVHKSKLLQVVTNLIKNACEAMGDNDALNKRQELTLDVGRHGANFARLNVIDNGCGIAKENLTVIFNHGFTTKAEGHGFGLHTSALSMKEMGGEIRAHSEGVGSGAIFTLLIPLAPYNSETDHPSVTLDATAGKPEDTA